MTASKWEGFVRAALDFEATSTDPHTARIVSAAWVTWGLDGRPRTRSWIVNPGVEIPDEAAAVHGITTERAQAEGIPPDVMLFELTGLVALTLHRGIPVVIYNAPYDLGLLEAENERHGIDTIAARRDGRPIAPIFDPLVIARYADPKRMVTVKDEHGNVVKAEGSKAALKRCRNCSCGAVDWTLTSTCLHYRVPLRAAHTAEADALASGRLFPKVMAAHARQFPGMTVDGLHHAQIGWARAQADRQRGIFNWLRVEDHDECPNPVDHQCCDPSWPLLPAPVAVDERGVA